MIKGVRIDGRLIHGQVANLWVPKLGITRVIVVDNDIVNSDIEKSSLKLATPAGVKLSVLTPEKAATNILAGRYNSQQVLIVVKKPNYLVELVELGVPIDKVNVGNMSQSEGSKPITKSVHVLENDIKDFEILNEKGVKLVHQMVPSDNENSFMDLLKNR
ncbi:PTS system mannose/fructose/N-acetylgalactosamine-transporter subunit IIB [Virgibacillus pantothenticus]|uniref:PTS system mannose/fructose/N-acetylgalactosamine-transporter subunit IIB n=1 Tax=Virgibacillus pantothenticus TaxID=1473 RepID=UPI0009859F1A|nr:PTS sugar transporter subunit IIB [Virgibacillus pantothenticus]